MRGLSGRGLSGAVNLVERQGEYETGFEVLGNSSTALQTSNLPQPRHVIFFFFNLVLRENKKIQYGYHSFAPCPPFGNLALQSHKIDVSSVMIYV